MSKSKLVKPQSAGSRTRLEPVKASHQIEANIPQRTERSSARSNRMLMNLDQTASHVTIRTSRDVSKNTNVVSMGRVPNDIAPSPPMSAKPTNRPSSATRFRQRVLACRET